MANSNIKRVKSSEIELKDKLEKLSRSDAQFDAGVEGVVTANQIQRPTFRAMHM